MSYDGNAVSLAKDERGVRTVNGLLAEKLERQKKQKASVHPRIEAMETAIITNLTTEPKEIHALIRHPYANHTMQYMVLFTGGGAQDSIMDAILSDREEDGNFAKCCMHPNANYVVQKAMET